MKRQLVAATALAFALVSCSDRDPTPVVRPPGQPSTAPASRLAAPSSDISQPEPLHGEGGYIPCPPEQVRNYDSTQPFAATLHCMRMTDGRVARVGPHDPSGQRLICLTPDGADDPCGGSIVTADTGDLIPMGDQVGRIGPFTNDSALIFCTSADGVESACGAIAF
jgi:hypothetical protein